MALDLALRLGAVLLFVQVARAVLAPTMQLNDGRSIPALALGTGRGTSRDKPVEEVRHAVLWALQAGYRHVDTAAVYQDEREVGQGIADAVAAGVVRREDVFVTTKLWNNRHAREQVVPALRESLQKLGLDYVDLYLIHFPIAQNDDDSPANIDYLDTWRGMEEAQKLGLAKSIGVSNFNRQQLDRLFNNSHFKPAVNQIEVERGLIPIPKSTNKERIAQNIDLFDFRLTPEEISTIDAFNKDVRVIEADYWKDHPDYPFKE